MPSFTNGAWPFSGFPNAPFRLNKHSPQAKGLVGWWPPLGSRGSNTLHDFKGANDGTLVNTPTWSAASLMGAVIGFDGASNQYIDIGSAAELDNIFAGGGSISVWFIADGWGEINFGRIFFKGSGNDNSTQLYMLGPTSASNTNTIQFRRSFSGNRLASWDLPTNRITLGNLYHAVIVYNEDSTDNDPVIYLNGVAQSISEEWGAPAGTAESDAAFDLLLGAWSPTIREFDGRIGDLRIYNYELSVGQVRQLYAPQTRWQLYGPVPRVFPVILPVGLEQIVGPFPTHFRI